MNYLKRECLCNLFLVNNGVFGSGNFNVKYQYCVGLGQNYTQEIFQWLEIRGMQANLC